MQHARLTGSGSTGGTGHDGNLFGGEFFPFHSDRMQKYRARNSSILHTFLSVAAFRKNAAISVVQDDTEEGIVHVNRALVLDKA
jgi:hypothetical protein